MIVVSNTSPILNLAIIGRLNLLVSLYRTILIPESVHQELSRSDAVQALVDLHSAHWLFVGSAQNRTRVSELCRQIDPGEAKAIVLALETEADLLLMDERRGRRSDLYTKVLADLGENESPSAP